MSSTSSTGKKLFFLMGYECVAEASWQIKVKMKHFFRASPENEGEGWDGLIPHLARGWVLAYSSKDT